MSLSATIGILLFVATLSTLIVGDPLSVLVVSSTKVTHNPNDYFDLVTIEIIKTKRSSQLTATIPVKEELPSTMQIKLMLGLGEDAFEFTIPVCDALTDPFVGSSFVKAGVPKDKFPKACPVGPGDWTVLKWDPPVHIIPPGIPDGPISGSITFLEEGSPPCFQVDFEGVLSHALPSFGR